MGEYHDFNEPVDYNTLMEYLNKFSWDYDFMKISYLGTSLLGRAIPIVKLGEGEQKVMYVGTHHSLEWITTLVLLRFIGEYCEYYKYKRRIYNLNIEYLFSNRTIYIVPMLNPDGVELVLHGITEDNPLKERLIRMNDGSSDFSRWNANARGVDLNHNYNAGFIEYKKLEAERGIDAGPTRYSGEYAESEPETAALCSFIRFTSNLRLLLALHSQGEEIYWEYNGQTAPNSLSRGRMLARMSGYKLAEPEGLASYGGLKDWFLLEYNRPAYTIECGKGENPLPVEDGIAIYSKLREILFTSPILC